MSMHLTIVAKMQSGENSTNWQRFHFMSVADLKTLEVLAFFPGNFKVDNNAKNAIPEHSVPSKNNVK